MNDNIGGMKPFHHKILAKFYDFEPLWLIEVILVISSFTFIAYKAAKTKIDRLWARNCCRFIQKLGLGSR